MTQEQGGLTDVEREFDQLLDRLALGDTSALYALEPDMVELGALLLAAGINRIAREGPENRHPEP